MFRFTAVMSKSAYVAYLLQTAGSQELAGLSVGERGRRCGAAFRALSATERESLRRFAPKSFPKKIHGHSGFQFYMKTHGGIIDEQAVNWQKLDLSDKRGYRNRGKFVPLVPRAASKAPQHRRALSPWATFLKQNKREFAGCSGREALAVTRRLAKQFKQRSQ